MNAILLCEKSGQTYLHGLFLIPDGVSKDQAWEDSQDARDQVRKDNPEEWNYDDVAKILVAKGYREIQYVESWE
jgi:hypothetical protein